jgi:hypothetical protein
MTEGTITRHQVNIFYNNGNKITKIKKRGD